MRIKNPFRTKSLFWITPKIIHKVELPFIGKPRQQVIPNITKVRGQKVDLLIIDEIVEQPTE